MQVFFNTFWLAKESFDFAIQLHFMIYFSEDGIEWHFGNISVTYANVYVLYLIHSLQQWQYCISSTSSWQKHTLQSSGFICEKKTERVSHVTRQMGSNFRRHLKEFKGKRLEGFGGEGRLAVARIDAIQNFYRHTICDANKEDV